MPDRKITCPNCGFKISLTETLSNEIKEGVRKEFEARERAREAEFRRREGELEKTFEERLGRERQKFVREAEEKAAGRFKLDLAALKEENEEKGKRLDEAARKELDLRKKARALEEANKNMELTVARTLDAERERIRREALEVFSEEHRLKDREKDKKVSDMLIQIEELKRKAEQGSVQTQGEVQELDLEEMLRSVFPFDSVEPVPKGFRGADIVQRVFTRNGHHCGSIVWESKRTKAWNNDWISKLKEDQREIKAEMAVIVTETLPKEINSFALLDGVWVTANRFATGLAEALRVGLIQVARSRASATGRGEKMEAVYHYLTGPEFRQKVEAIVEVFRTLKDELETEKRSMTRIWARREKQIERVIMNTARMYGDIDGIIGATLPPIKTLELEGDGGGEEGEREPEEEEKKKPRDGLF